MSTLKITHPSGSPATIIEPLSLRFGGDLNEPLALRFTLPADYDDYSDDASSTNPLQLHSAVEFSRGSDDDFLGEIISARAVEDGAAAYPQQIEYECVDRLGAIKRCLASTGGDALASIKTSTTLRSNQSLLPLVAASTSYYPDPASSALWLAVSGTPRTVFTSTAGLTAGITTLVTLSSQSLRMLTKGLLSLGVAAEYVAYDGYDDNGSVYVFSNLTRGVLGSSDITHGSVVVNQFIAKRIDPDQAITIEGDTGGATWLVIDPSLYTVDYESGSVEFNTDPSAAYPGGIRGTYYTFDEDDADAYLLGGDNTYGVIELLLQETQANGGPGLTSSDYSIDVPRVVLPVTKLIGQNTIDAIAQLLEEKGFAGWSYDAAQPEEWPLAYWYDSPNAELVIDTLNPSDSPVATIVDAEKIGRDNSLGDVQSGVYVKWTTDLEEYGALVQVSSALGGSGDVRNATVNTKLRATGYPRIELIDCGECSEGTAISIAKNRLRQSWLLAYAREYVLKTLPDTLPVRGKRYIMPDGLRARCISVSYSNESGREQFTMKVIDLDQEIA